MTAAAGEHGRQQRLAILTALGAILLVAVLLRCLGLGLRPAFDEAATWSFITLPWKQFWQVIWRAEGNSVAYYLSARGWLMFGEELTTLRTLPLVLGVATLPFMYLLGARLFGRRAGLIAAALLAVHAFHIRWSQEARGYSMTALLVVISTWLFVVSLHDRSRRVVVSYVLVSALACYCHVLAVLVLGAQWLWFLGVHGWRALGGRSGTLVGLALGCAPVIWYAVAQDSGQIDWVGALTLRRGVAGFTSLVGGDRANLLLFAILGTAALWYALRTRDAQLRRATALATMWLALPLVFVVLVSPLKNLFVDRYLLICLPALVLLAAAGIDGFLRGRAPAKLAGAGLAAALLAACLHATYVEYRSARDNGNPLREATHYVLEHRQPNDGVFLFTAATYFPYAYHAHLRDPATDPLLDTVFPDFNLPQFGGIPTGLQPNPSADQVRAAIASRQHLWLLLNRSGIRLVKGAAEAEPVIRAVIEQQFELADQRELGFIQVLHYSRRAPQQ